MSPAIVVATGDSERVANQDAAEQPIGPPEHLLHADRAAVALAHEILQAKAVDRHHRGLGDREKRRHDDHRAERAEQPVERDVFHRA
jgi:hypothetical protein